MKPRRGYISNFKIVPVEDNEACVIKGNISGHPYFQDWIITSIVVAVYGRNVETLNSTYTLIGKPLEGAWIFPSARVLKKYSVNQEN